MSILRRFAAAGFTAAALTVTSPLAAQSAPAPIAAVDPALLAKAEIAAKAILPEGSMEMIMGPMFDQISKQLSGSMLDFPLSTVAGMAGLSPEQTRALGEGTVQELVAIMDPAFNDRMRLMMRVMGREMGPLMTRFEPEMRDGMARAFARKYSAAELDQINGFFGTPVGARFGAGFMQLAADPEYLRSMEVMMPKLMEAMPSIMAKAAEETKTLPPPRRAEDLSEADRKRINDLLGIKEQDRK